jgi:DNA modification methylase
VSSVDVVQGDCLEVLRALDDESVDAVVCDPPYGLEFMGKEWDKLDDWRDGGAFSKPGIGERPTPWPSFGGETANPSCRGCGGRKRGKKKCSCTEPDWHVAGADFDPSAKARQRNQGMQDWHHAWALEAFRVLKPGGYLIAASGSRTYHRLACAVEDAGFEVRDMLEWAYGSGFPKSLDVSKAIDKAAGAERTVVTGTRHRNVKPFDDANGWNANGTTGDHAYTAPATPEAAQWEGWGTALKPAHEPFVLARKPLAGTVAQNVQAHGTGALNIDGCRVATAKGDEVALHGRAATENGWDARWANAQEPGQTAGQALGRWPPNFLLSHDPRCECVGTTVVRGDNRDADALGGARPGGFGDVGADKGDGKPNGTVYGDEEVPVYRCVEGCPVAAMDAQSGMLKSGVMTGMQRGWGKHGIYGASGDTPATCYADSGGASRFFPILNWDPEYDVPFLYCAKAPQKEREAGCESLPERLSSSMSGRRNADNMEEAKVDNDVTARFTSNRRNHHPTVKPVNLMRWLLRLVVPPGGFFVDPFAGSGTTGVAALLEGFDGLLIEKEAAYVPIIEARLAHARAMAK